MKLKCNYGAMPCPKLEILGERVARCMGTLNQLPFYHVAFYRDDNCPIEKKALDEIGKDVD